MDFTFISNILHKNTNSFNNLGNKPIGLTRYLYISTILPNIENYMLTDKADGEHAFFIHDNNPRYLLSRDTIHVKDKIPPPIKGTNVYDVEIINNEIYVFDILMYNGKNVSYLKFKERHNILLEAEKQNKSSIIHFKYYETLLINTYQKNIMKMYKKKYDYEIDGLIFTSINDSFNKTLNYKWKPPEKLTIDFLIKNNTLCVGMNKKALQLYGPIDNNTFKKDNNDTDYIPVPFISSLGDKYSIASIDFNNKTTLEEANGRIAELSLNYTKSNFIWTFHRYRPDREVDMKNNTYYGNNFKVAELTLQTSLNPLTFSDLTMPYKFLKHNFYFQKTDDVYLAPRKFNNYVKNNLIQKYISTIQNKNVLDMASGKGQDLQKYIESKVSNLTMLEIDNNAIEEIIKRKYDILDRMAKNNNIQQHYNIKVFNMDLNKPWKNNITAIIDNTITNNSITSTSLKKYPLIICNLALHYLTDTKEHMENICNFIGNMIDINGIFLFTILDGNNVFNISPWKDDKYIITIPNKKKKFTGFEKINIKLPFSDDLQEEKLINLYTLDKIFRQHKMIRIETHNFNEYLDSFKNEKQHFYNMLSESDKKYVSMYCYAVYKKTI